MTTREAPIERFYDPAALDPGAPRLRVRKDGGAWELWDDAGGLVSRHPTLSVALDAAEACSRRCYSEILVRSASGRHEWSYHHNPEWMALARVLNHALAPEREAAD